MLSFLTLGFISRTVPQLNILTIGFPIKAAVGILIMALGIMSLEPVLLGGLTEVMDSLRESVTVTGVSVHRRKRGRPVIEKGVRSEA
jgi:flagellar biosynthesis protein FliR